MGIMRRCFFLDLGTKPTKEEPRLEPLNSGILIA